MACPIQETCHFFFPFTFEVKNPGIDKEFGTGARKCLIVLNLFDTDILIKKSIVLFDVLLTSKFHIQKLPSLLLLKIVNISCLWLFWRQRKIKEFWKTIVCFSNYVAEYMLVTKVLFKFWFVMSALSNYKFPAQYQQILVLELKSSVPPPPPKKKKIYIYTFCIYWTPSRGLKFQIN